MMDSVFSGHATLDTRMSWKFHHLATQCLILFCFLTEGYAVGPSHRMWKGGRGGNMAAHSLVPTERLMLPSGQGGCCLLLNYLQGKRV